MKDKIEILLQELPTSEKINILESLCKKYRRENSARINAKQMGRRVDDERPDLQTLKSK
jgi:hypothetical protein